MYYKRGLTYDQAFFSVEHRKSTDEDQQIIIHQSIQKLKVELFNSTVLAAGKLTELSILPFL